MEKCLLYKTVVLSAKLALLLKVVHPITGITALLFPYLLKQILQSKNDESNSPHPNSFEESS